MKVPTKQQIRAVTLALLEDRGTSTACPSEVARRLAPDDWRPLMEAVRSVAAALQKKGLLDVYQHGRPVTIAEARGPIRLRSAGATAIDYRKYPERYRIGRGEEGVLSVQPYKSELLPLWKFATPAMATRSSTALLKRFRAYGVAGDFIGMDMARKFLQMGWTRARRYANHASGRKYAKGTRVVLPAQEDKEKAESARIFKAAYDRARTDAKYLRLRAQHVSLVAAAKAAEQPESAGAPTSSQPR